MLSNLDILLLISFNIISEMWVVETDYSGHESVMTLYSIENSFR
jgi:hypothetical protein